MRKAREYRKEARGLLGNGIFDSKWLYALLVLLLASIIVAAAGSITVGIIAIVVAGPIEYGTISCLLRVARHEDERADASHLFDGFKEKFGQSFVVALLESIFIFLWTLLFIIPGIIKGYSYSATMYLVRERNLEGTAAITESRRLMKGKKWKLFCLDLSFIGWYFVGLLCLGIGLLWVEPYHQMARTVFFEDLLKADAPVEVEAKPAE